MRHAIAASSLAVLLIAFQVCWSATKPVKTAAHHPATKTTVHKAAKAAAPAADTLKKADETTEPAAAADSTAPGGNDTATAVKQPEKKAPAGPTTADDFRKLGDQHAKKGQIDKAMEAYKLCLEKSSGDDSANGRIFVTLGRYCYDKKQYDEALQYFSKAKGKATEQFSFKTMVAGALQLTGKNDSAIALLEPIASNQKIAVNLRKGMFKIIGDAYLKSGKPDKATLWYGKHLSTGGAKTTDMAYLMASAQEKTAPAKAKLAYEANLKAYPNDYRNFLALAMMQSKNKATLQSALGLLRKASTLADTVPSVWLEIGKVYARMGKKDDELESYRTCLRGDENNLEAKTRLGMALLDNGQTEDAITYLESAHKQAPDSVGPMGALATAYIKTDKSKKAIEMLTKLKTAQPKNVEVRKQLAMAYQATGQDQKAMEEINGGLELERDFELLLSGAKLNLKLGKPDDAVVLLEELLGGMPDNIEALMTMAKVKRSQKKLDEAIEVYKEVSIYDTKYAPALYERAEIHLEQSKAKWAEMFYQRALAADPQYALAEVGLAKVALLFNDRNTCYDHLAKAEAMAPNDPVVQKAIENAKNPPKSSAVANTNAPSGNDNATTDDDAKTTKKKRKK